MELDFNKALEFVKKYHDGQYHANKVLVWHHLLRVSKRLEFILDNNKEGSVEERRGIVVASLGHDLLEDTKAPIEEVKDIFGDIGLGYIQGMTNTWGGSDLAPYVGKVVNSSEEIRLIKLADLFDNMTSVTYNLSALGKEWIGSYFLPVVTPMKEAVLKTSFNKYSKSGEVLKFMVESAFCVLLDEFKRMS